MTGRGVLVVLVTTSDADEARRLASALVEESLAACGNVVPGLTSIFRWEGAVQNEDEALLFLKTTAACFPELEERIGELHSYDVPEILALPVAGGGAAYLEWVAEAVEPGS